jgi:hypothetical protein
MFLGVMGEVGLGEILGWSFGIVLVIQPEKAHDGWAHFLLRIKRTSLLRSEWRVGPRMFV